MSFLLTRPVAAAKVERNSFRSERNKFRSTTWTEAAFKFQTPNSKQVEALAGSRVRTAKNWQEYYGAGISEIPFENIPAP
jgi:hypothetical protein